MKTNWVDFKAVKQAVSLEHVLRHYGVLEHLRGRGDERHGKCPIHRGEGDETFHANLKKNAFHCFSCKARGNVLDFVAAMDTCSVREAAVKLQQWFGGSGTQSAPTGRTRASSELAREEIGERTEPNKPLGFALSGIDPAHPYFAERGIDKETAEYFGAGFFSGKGSMKGRVVIPIENEQGELVAYAGRSIDGSEPKYKLPAGFHKSAVLFNLPRALEEDSTGAVVLVEGFFDCMKVVQANHVCVALMGCSLSKAQEQQLVQHFKQMVVMLDGDQAGKTAAAEIVARLAHQLWVRIVDVPEGKQPDQLQADELDQILSKI